MTYLRIILIIIFFLPIAASAQKDEEPKLWKTNYRTVLVEDTARFDVIYEHVQRDAKLDQSYTSPELLSIGDKVTVYGGYDNYRLDSLYSSPYYATIKEMSSAERDNWWRTFRTVRDCVTINPEEGVLTYYGKIFINPYRYFEPIPVIEWVLTDDTEEIMGYECHKATAKWRGREWSAWYSDIPVNAGPWKFQGLPGLILKVEDSAGDHSICAIATRKLEYPIGHGYKGWCKTTREKYNEAREDHAEHGSEMFVKSGMVTAVNGKKAVPIKRRLFYAPLELE